MSNKEYNGHFSWKIIDPFAVSEFLQAPPGIKFSSDTFTIGGLRWQLYAYPRGRYANNKWSNNSIRGCELYLQLISSSFPQDAYKIIFNYRLFCLNASSSYTNIQQFIRNQDHYVSWYKGTLTTNELGALEGQTIHLQCYINVLKILAYDQKSIIYQFPYKIYNKNEIEFEWKIKNINGLFINTKCGKHIESKIFDNFWCLRIAPKGWKLKQQKYVNLWLQLCCLPMNISKINVNYQIRCIETNTYYSKNASFDYNMYHKNAPWDQKKLVTNYLKNYDSLTFKCNIQILKKYDCNGFAIRNNRNNNNIECDGKSPEIDALKQEITKLNTKMSEMHQTIKELKSQIGVSDDEKMNINILEMLKQTKKEIELLKNNKSASHTKGHLIKNWLQNIVKLPEYFDIFIENGFEDMKVIKMLTGKQLELLGIQKLGHKMKILSAIKDLNNNNDMHTIDGSNAQEINEGQFYPSPGQSNYM